MNVVNYLMQVTQPDLYVRSPFRVVGLETHVDIGLVYRRRAHMLSGLRSGGDAMPGGDPRLPLPQVTRRDLVWVASTLRAPDKRVVEELFWWWGDARACGCPVEVHRLHDDAVHAHATVLDLENQAEPGGEHRIAAWRLAASKWGEALAHEGFWRHVRFRAGRAFDHAKLRAAALPTALLQPQVVLARQRDDVDLMALLDEWDVDEDVRDEARRCAAEWRLAEVRASLVPIDTDFSLPGSARRIAHDVDRVVAALYRLEEALPNERFRWAWHVLTPVGKLLQACGVTVTTADLDDLCSALEDAARWLRAEQAKRTQRQQHPPVRWYYRPDRAERLDRVRQMLANGSFRSATRELEDWRAHATEDSELVEIRKLLDEVERGEAKPRPGERGPRG